MQTDSKKHNTPTDANNVLCAVPNIKIKLRGGKNQMAFSRGLNKVFNDLIWVELHHKYGDMWFFDKVVLMSISEVELA